MKVKKVLAAIVCLLVACLSFAGCEWGNKKYSLRLTVNNEAMGKVTSSPLQAEYQKDTQITVTALPNFGYEFVFWLNDNGEPIKTTSGFYEGVDYTFNINKDTSLQAVFKKAVTISYDLQGGKVKDGGATTYTYSNSIKVGDELPLPELEKENCDFIGWKVNGEWERGSFYKVESLSNNFVAIAQFRDSKTIKFELNGGVTANGEELADITKVDESTKVTLPVLTKTGYTFEGWTLGEREVANAEGGQYSVLESDLNAQGHLMTFSAEWSANSYDVELMIKNSEGVWENINTNPDNKVVLTYDKPIGDLIKFNEAGDKAYFWYNSDVIYVDGELNETNRVDSTKTWKEPNGKTFYGRTEDAHKYVIDVDGEKTTFVIAESDEKEYDVETEVLQQAVAKEGFTFNGFYVEGDDTTRIEKISYGENAVTNITAKFTINRYNVIFSKHGESVNYMVVGSNYNETDKTAEFNDTIKFKVEVNAGYKLIEVFYNIKDAKVGTLTLNENGEYSLKIPANDVVIAVETKIIYTVNYYTNAETKIELNEETAKNYVTSWLQGSYDVGDKVFYKLSPIADKNFAGWALTPGLTSAEDALITSEGVITEGFWDEVTAEIVENKTLNLYAVWTKADLLRYEFNMSDDGAGYSIIPDGYLLKPFNSNTGFYGYLTYLAESYNAERLAEIKANAESASKEDIVAYNLIKVFNVTQSGEAHVAKWTETYSDLIIKNGNAVAPDMTVRLNVTIIDSNNNVFTNASGEISNEVLSNLQGDLSIEFVFRK